MSKAMLTLATTETDDDSTIYRYDCDFTVELAGDSIWNCALKRVHVTGITVIDTDYDGEIVRMVNVEHDGEEDSWRMYTDTGFENVIGQMLGFAVRFTEQGMQEDGFASLEAA